MHGVLCKWALFPALLRSFFGPFLCYSILLFSIELTPGPWHWELVYDSS